MDVSMMQDPTARATVLAVALSAFSTVHTFMAMHPRAQACFKAAAHLAGPFNLPAVRLALVEVARAVVAYEDGDVAAAVKDVELVAEQIARAVIVHPEPVLPGPSGPPPIPEQTPATTGTVKSW